MADWPISIQKPEFNTEEELFKPQIRQIFDGNYVQSRPATTRAVRRWTLKWNFMKESDYATLMTFFVTNQGNSFNFTHPITGVVSICRFSDNSIKSTWADVGVRAVSCMIEEV